MIYAYCRVEFNSESEAISWIKEEINSRDISKRSKVRRRVYK